MKKLTLYLAMLPLSLFLTGGPYSGDKDRIDRKREFYQSDDFDASLVGWLTATINGGSIGYFGETGHPGEVYIQTGATSGGGGAVYRRSVTFQGPVSNQKMTFQTYVRLNNLTSKVARIGFHDISINTFPTDGIWFEFNTDSSATKWWCGTASNSTKTFDITSTTATTNWMHLKIEVSSTLARFFIDNVLVSTHTTNIPQTGRDFGYGYTLHSLASTADGKIFIDEDEVSVIGLSRPF